MKYVIELDTEVESDALWVFQTVADYLLTHDRGSARLVDTLSPMEATWPDGQPIRERRVMVTFDPEAERQRLVSREEAAEFAATFLPPEEA